ncbi:MAG TPA: hypothetical protein V6C90_12390 [Coleofasciculaceae cyanobacterium]
MKTLPSVRRSLNFRQEAIARHSTPPSLLALSGRKFSRNSPGCPVLSKGDESRDSYSKRQHFDRLSDQAALRQAQ